jgi:hypothetical protein
MSPSSSVSTSSAVSALRWTSTPRGPRHADRGGTTTRTGSTADANGAPNHPAAERPARTASSGITSAAPLATRLWSTGMPGST